MEYTFSNRCWLTFEQPESGEEFPDRDAAGFHIPGAFDKVLDIKNATCRTIWAIGYACLSRHMGRNMALRSMTEGTERLPAHAYDTHSEHRGVYGTYGIRRGNRPADIEALMQALADEFPSLTSIMYAVNTKVNDTLGDIDIKLFKGKEYIEEEMEGFASALVQSLFIRQTQSRHTNCTRWCEILRG